MSEPRYAGVSGADTSGAGTFVVLCGFFCLVFFGLRLCGCDIGGLSELKETVIDHLVIKFARDCHRFRFAVEKCIAPGIDGFAVVFWGMVRPGNFFLLIFL